jgi:hypothetical protein
MDQDALNMALMGSKVPFLMAGPEAMAFAPGGVLMAHAVATPKPWQRRHLRRALRGFRISYASRAYWNFVREPIPVFTEAQRRGALIEIKIAAAIARICG